MTPTTKLDRIDIKILAALQSDGRVSNVDLAERVGLSQSPCLQRVKRLERAGFIERYQAVIALPKLGDFITVFTEITLENHGRDDFLRFEAAIGREPSVVECHLVSGGYDYLVKFVTRGIADYQTKIEALLAAEIGIAKYFSFVVIKSSIEGRAPDLPSLLDKDQA